MNNLRATIDIGSNSILLLVVDCSENYKVIANESNVTGLGRDLDKNHKFIDEAMDESFAVLNQYVKICSSLGLKPEDILATATEAARVSTNAHSFFEKVKDCLGLDIIIISGEAEAYYSSVGLLFDQNITDDIVTIMDIGGASTELIQVERSTQKISTSFSMPVGVVRMNNWFEESKREEKLAQVLSDFKQRLGQLKTSRLFCVAGTMTSVGNMYLGLKDFQEAEVNGLELKVQAVKEMQQKYHSYTADDFLATFPFLGKRSKTIYSGLVLANTIFSCLDVEEIYISTYGLRYGTMLAGKIEDKYVWKRS